MPIPKQILQTVCRWFSPAADRTMRNISTTRGPPTYSHERIDRLHCHNVRPTHIGKSVTMMNTGAALMAEDCTLPTTSPAPRSWMPTSFAPSLALVEDAGYSPPAPCGRCGQRSICIKLIRTEPTIPVRPLANVMNQKSPWTLP